MLFRVRQREISTAATVGAGALAGMAMITEYPAVLLVGTLALYLLAQAGERWPRMLWFAAGAAPLLAVGAVYNTLAFGGPLSQGYAHLAGPQVFRQGQAQGFMGITYPHLDALWQTTFGPYRGAFLLSPILLLAIPGFVYLWRRANWRAEWALWLGSAVVYLLFMISYFEWDGGFSIGPRQFLPALPYVVLPIGELVRRERARGWRWIVAVFSSISIAVVVLATATGPLFDPAFKTPITQYLVPSLLGITPDPAHPAAAWDAVVARGPVALSGFMSAKLDNNWGMALGLPGIAQLAPIVVLCALILVWRIWQERHQTRALRAVAAAAEAALSLTRGPFDAATDSTDHGDVSTRLDAAPPAPVPGGVTVHQAVGALGNQAQFATDAASRIDTLLPPWEAAILDAVRTRGDLPSSGVLRGIGAVKSMLRMSQELAVFKHIRSILVYGPLAHGDDPLLEVNVLIICNPVKGPFGVERAFAEIDGLGRRVEEQSGVRLRPLIVVRGQSERDVPGEPSWRDLARRGLVVYGVEA